MAAEVKMQLDTEGWVVLSTYGMAAGEIGVTQASEGWVVLSTYEMAAGEIGVTKASSGNKEAGGGSSTSNEIGVVTKAEPGNTKEEAGGSSTGGEISGSKADLIGNKVTEASWVDYVLLSKKESDLYMEALKQGRKAEPMEAMITKENVPYSFITILLNRRPFNKYPPMTDDYCTIVSMYDPKVLELAQADIDRRNCCVDLHYDILRQYKKKGFAEVGVDLTGGVKKLFVLSNSEGN